MLKETADKMEGNAQFEGFGIELIDELSKKLGFSYTFYLQPDNKYGGIDPKTGEWNGMLREIIDNVSACLGLMPINPNPTTAPTQPPIHPATQHRSSPLCAPGH